MSGLLHVIDESVVVEVLRGGRPAGVGEEGTVVITPLHSFAMPLIRFDLGDIAVRGPSECPCGCQKTTLQRVAGRTVEYFPMPDGRLLHPYAIVGTLLASAPWARRYKIVQDSLQRITILVVAWESPHPDALVEAARKVSTAVGPGVEVRIEVVDTIPSPRTGKEQPYESRVAPEKSG